MNARVFHAAQLCVSSYYCVCVLIPLYIFVLIPLQLQLYLCPCSTVYMCPHTTVYICPRTTVYMSPHAFVYIFVLILGLQACECIRNMCVLILAYTSPHTAMCPHTAIILVLLYTCVLMLLFIYLSSYSDNRRVNAFAMYASSY